MDDCGETNVVLLEGSFAIYPKTTKYRVLVTSLEISYVPRSNSNELHSSKKSSAHVIKLADVIGADCMRGKTANCQAAYLNIYAYPHRRKLLTSRRTLRRRHCVTFVFAQFASFEQNHTHAMHWQLVITYLVRGIDVKLEGN